MIEEIDSTQYVQHYFQKVYTELEHSPESFLRAALEFVERQDGLLSQPGSLESLSRLAQEIIRRGANDDSPVSSPETSPAPVAPHAREAVTDSTAPTAAVSSPAPAASVEMADAEEPAPVRRHDDDEDNSEDADEEEAESKGYPVNEGNGADFPSYSWTQSLNEAIITIPVPSGTKGKMCDVEITRSHLRAGIKGAETPILNGQLPFPVKTDESFWNLVDGKTLEITLAKVDSMQWWRAVVVGEPEIDASKVEPEASKLSDLDGEMRATVEKMMFDQRQKALGLPTSEESAKQEAYKKFMDSHPEMDFSDAKFM